MRRDFGDRLLELGVHVELRRYVFLLAFLANFDRRRLEVGGAEQFADIGVLGDPLCANVPRPRQRSVDVRHVLLHADEASRVGRRHTRKGLRPDEIGERLEAAFHRHDGARSPLRSKRQIEILDLRLAGRTPDLGLELGRQLALVRNLRQHALDALVQLEQVSTPLLDRSDRDFVEAVRRLLAIARDERDGRPVGEQLNHRRDTARRQRELGGDRRNGIIGGNGGSRLLSTHRRREYHAHLKAASHPKAESCR